MLDKRNDLLYENDAPVKITWPRNSPPNNRMEAKVNNIAASKSGPFQRNSSASANTGLQSSTKVMKSKPRREAPKTQEKNSYLGRWSIKAEERAVKVKKSCNSKSKTR